MPRTKQKVIPGETRGKVVEIVADFNLRVIDDPKCFYVPRFRGGTLYLDRSDYGQIGHVCRLQYQGEIDDWEFAIYKYSGECYDPDEWFFPGAELVDGTLEGAMKAGMEAYPPTSGDLEGLMGILGDLFKPPKR